MGEVHLPAWVRRFGRKEEREKEIKKVKEGMNVGRQARCSTRSFWRVGGF